MSQTPLTTTSRSNFQSVFNTTLKAYKIRTGNDIADHPLSTSIQSCTSLDAILSVLQEQACQFDQYRSDSERLKKWLNPTVNVLYAFSATLGEGVGLVFSPAKVIFAGIGVLLLAAKDVDASQETLVDLFDQIGNFFKRLETYVEVPATSAMTDTIVKIMVEVLCILTIATREIKQGWTKKYFKKLVGKTDLEDALQKLDRLTQEEARMATAQVLKITHDVDNRVKLVEGGVKNIDDKVDVIDDTVQGIDDKVDVVDKRVEVIDVRVQGVDDRVQGVDGRVKGVDHKVQGLDDKMQGVDDKVQLVDDRVQVVNDSVNAVEDRVSTVDHKVNQVIDDGKETRVAVHQIANEMGDLNRNQLGDRLRNWLSPPDPSINYNTALGAHHKGTAGWFTQGETFMDWKSSGSLLWIHGKPGSGKSILSSAVIRDVEAISNTGSGFMAYFYFDFKDTGKQDSHALLTSLLVQLSDQSDMFCNILVSLFLAHRRGSQQPTDGALTRCLKDMLMIPGKTPIYLIVDALDECPNTSGMPSPREKAIEILEELVQSNLPKLRLCVTSRPEIDIRNSLEPLAFHRMSLHDESGQTKDIVDYVRSVVYSDKKMRRWRDEDKKVVIDTLSEKADGMFRWVFCQLETLRHSLPPSVRRILEELPESLDETYERVLREINKANRDHAHRLLQCLTVAFRPLRVEELAEVLVIDFTAGGIAKVNADWRWEDQEEAVLSACSSLIAVIDDHGSRVIQFSHFSVKEFLTSDRLAASKGDVGRYYIPLEPAHVILVQACLGVLLRLDDQVDKESMKGIPLADYAIEHWFKHMEFENVLSQIKDAIDFFFDGNKPHLTACLRIHETNRGWIWDDSPYEMLSMQPGAVPLFFAVQTGSRGLVEYLVGKYPQHINAKGGEYGALLPAAVHKGYTEVAWSLIEHGADVNIRGRWEQTSLIRASVQGSGLLHVVQRLLKLGADVDAKDDEEATSLHRVVSNSNIDIVRVLLKHKADTNSQNVDGWTPLHFAAERRHLEIMRLLLEYGANPHLRQNGGRTPLHLVSMVGPVEAAQCLLDVGADPDAHDDEHATPLHHAAHKGNLNIVQVLLEHKADVNCQNNKGQTPLHRASENGHAGVVRLLLENGANAHARDHDGRTPSQVAPQEIVELLSEYGAG